MNRHFLLGIAILLFALGVWKFSGTPSAPVIAATPVESAGSSVQVATSESDPEEAEPEAAGVESLSLEMASRKFSRAISEAGSCLGIAMIAPGGEAPPTLAEWTAAARNDLGDPVVTTEDWSVTTIQTPSGEKRHIRFEIDYSDPMQIMQKLS
ncbi:MAG: hypothetical protein KF789_13955, partial [Bdellovibrionaceae bacterium]|nr:hypothetical protein [Pseudobdellovibrionaceae bacterium]